MQVNNYNINNAKRQIGSSSKGRTTDFGSVNCGSSPRDPTKIVNI